MTTNEYLNQMTKLLHGYQSELDSAFRLDFTKDLFWHPIIKQKIRDRGVSHLNWGFSNREIGLDLIYSKLEKIEPMFSLASSHFKNEFRNAIDIQFLMVNNSEKYIPTFAEVYHQFQQETNYTKDNHKFTKDDLFLLSKISLEKEIKDLFVKHFGNSYESVFFNQFLSESPNLVKQVMDKKLAS